MPAFTALLNLYLPGGGSLGIGGADEAADIDKLNQNFQKIDLWAVETDTRLDLLDPQLTRNQQYRGLAAAKGDVVGPRRGDTYQETDGTYPKFFEHDGTNWKNRTRARAQLVSNTASIDGTVQLNWGGAAAGFVYQEGEKFWGSTGGDNALDVIAPMAGRYRVYYTYRTAGTSALSAQVLKNGTSLGNPAAASDTGGVGASSHLQKRFDIELAANDKLRVSIVAPAAGGAGSQGLFSIEYLGEV